MTHYAKNSIYQGVIKSSVKSDITAGNEKLLQKVVINSRSKIDSKSNYQRR